MILASPEEQGVYQLKELGEHVIAGFSGRNFSNTSTGDFLKHLKISDFEVVTLKQIHSANIIHVHPGHGDKHPSADGMLTQDCGIALGIRTADCVPVFFYDDIQKVIGLCHAGWKGTYFGIAEKMVQAMEQNFGSRAENIQVVLGPYIRPCCYEVGDEFKTMFPESFKECEIPEKGFMDLGKEILERLKLEGISKENFTDVEMCTCCTNDKFFSYRAEPATQERMLSVIALKK